MKGIKDPNYKRQTNWIAFESTQIKSAIANTGAFDPANKNMMLSAKPGFAGRDEGTSKLTGLMDEAKHLSLVKERFDDKLKNRPKDVTDQEREI